MTALRILVCQSPGEHAAFNITPAQAAAARARAAASLPAVEFVFCGPDDPRLADMVDSCHAMIGWKLPRALISRTDGPLRLIQTTGAGVEHLVPFDWLPARMSLANASGIHSAK